MASVHSGDFKQSKGSTNKKNVGSVATSDIPPNPGSASTKEFGKNKNSGSVKNHNIPARQQGRGKK